MLYVGHFRKCDGFDPQKYTLYDAALVAMDTLFH